MVKPHFHVSLSLKIQNLGGWAVLYLIKYTLYRMQGLGFKLTNGEASTADDSLPVSHSALSFSLSYQIEKRKVGKKSANQELWICCASTKLQQ